MISLCLPFETRVVYKNQKKLYIFKIPPHSLIEKMVFRKESWARTENMFFLYNLRMERGTVLILTWLCAQIQYL